MNKSIRPGNTLRALITAIALLGGLACSTADRAPSRTASRSESSVKPLSTLFRGKAWQVMPSTGLDAFDDIYFVSDLHGRFEQFANLLFRWKLVSRADGTGTWTAPRALLVINGDNIDGGSGGAQILRWIKNLKDRHPANIIATMGNHEARFLADPRPDHIAFETLASFAKDLGAPTPARVTAEQLRSSDLTAFMRAMPLAAIVGTWLVVHAGYIDATEATVAEYLERASNRWEDGGPAFGQLADETGGDVSSLLSRHDWWETARKAQRSLQQAMGITGVLIGHEPELFGGADDREHVKVSNAGWAVKLDTGLKKSVGKATDLKGEMFHCAVRNVRQPDGTTLFVSAAGAQLCNRATAKGISKPFE